MKRPLPTSTYGPWRLVKPARHGDQHAVGEHDQVLQQYAPGSFTIPTGQYAILSTLILTGSERVTLQGTARLRLV